MKIINNKKFIVNSKINHKKKHLKNKKLKKYNKFKYFN